MMDPKGIALAGILVFVGLGLSAYYSVSGAGNTTNYDGVATDGSYALKGVDEDGSNEIVIISQLVAAGTGTAGSDFLLKFEHKQINYRESEYTKITQFFGEKHAFIYAPNETSSYDSDERSQDSMTDCHEFDFSSLVAAVPGFKAPDKDGKTVAAFWGQEWEVKFGDDGKPTQLGPYTVTDFRHSNEDPDGYPEYWTDRTHDISLCAALKEGHESRRLAASEQQEKEDENVEQHDEDGRLLLGRRRLAYSQSKGSYDQYTRCGWWAGVQGIDHFKNADYYNGNARVTGMVCDKIRYPDANRGWETMFNVGSEGDEKITICSGTNTATGRPITLLQQWGTGGGQDIMRDLTLYHAGGTTHAGALWEAQGYMDALFAKHPASSMAQDILVSGFSLGGASAHVVAAHLEQVYGKNVVLITGGEFHAFNYWSRWSSGGGRPIQGNKHHRVIAGRDGLWTYPEWDPTPGITSIAGFMGYGTVHWAIDVSNSHLRCSGCSGCTGCSWGGCSGCSGCSGCWWQTSNYYDDFRGWPYKSPLAFIPGISAMNFVVGLIRDGDGSSEGPMMHFFDYSKHIQKAMCGLGGGSTSRTPGNPLQFF